MLSSSFILKDYRCELEILLLVLRAHCVSAEAASTLIQFVADVLLKSVQDHLLHEAQVDRILREAQLPSSSTSSCLAPLDDVLSAPLEIPDAASVSVCQLDDISNAE